MADKDTIIIDDEASERKLVIFGKDLSAVPCWRNSWLYGISGGLGSGLVYFLFTSKIRAATNVGFTSIMAITGAYWCVCRYQYEKQARELEKLREYIEKRVLIEGTEMEKLYEADAAKDIDVATVSNIIK